LLCEALLLPVTRQRGGLNRFKRLSKKLCAKFPSGKEVFREMDKDGNGSISKTEVMVALQRVNVFLTTEETCRLMETLAGDQSGKISEKSIIDFWNVSQVASELEEHQKLQGVTQTHKTDVTDLKESIPDVRVVVCTTDQKEFNPP